MTGRIFLDSNILIYAFDDLERPKQHVARRLIDEVGRSGGGVLSVQVLGELFHTAVIRRRMHTAAEADQIVKSLTTALEIAAIDYPLVEDAIRLHQRYQLRYWDALIVATARSYGCETVLSEDLNDGQDYDRVRVSNPFRVASGEGPAPY